MFVMPGDRVGRKRRVRPFGTNGQLLIGVTGANNEVWKTISGDLTLTSAGVFTIANQAVTYAKIQNVSATSRILGRKTAGAGSTEECTLSEVLDFVGSAAQGDILYRDAAGWARLGAGTSGQLLKTQGAGFNPVWVTAGGGTGDMLAANNLSDVASKATSRANLLADIGIGTINCSLAVSAAANALTIALKTKAATDPSASDPATIIFRNATATTGDYVPIDVTAATSLVISSGSTLGVVSATAFRLWIVAFNDAGTIRLGVINCRGTTSITPLWNYILASSTAEGGAGAADSSQVFYTGTAVTTKAYCVIGYVEWNPTGLATAGTWTTTNLTKVQLYGAGIPLPGETVQSVKTQDGGSVTATTTMPDDDTIPQNTEGVQFMTQAITPTSAANFLDISHAGVYSNTAGAKDVQCALFQDSVAGALAAAQSSMGAANFFCMPIINYRMVAATTSSTTFKIRAGISTAGNITFNGFGTGPTRTMGGVSYSWIQVNEIMT